MLQGSSGEPWLYPQLASGAAGESVMMRSVGENPAAPGQAGAAVVSRARGPEVGRADGAVYPAR